MHHACTGMEKAQIVRYALMQLVALIYGVLAAGVAVKVNKLNADQGYTMPDAYYRAIFVRDYGCWFFFIVILWALFAVYQTRSHNGLSEGTLTATGIGLAIVLALAGTSIAFAGAEPPPHLLIPLSP